MVPIQQLDIETKIGMSREEWIRYVLSRPFQFSYRGGVELHWTPKGRLEESFYGLVQRQRAHSLHRSPDEGGDEIMTEEWQGAYVLVDPTVHNEGQRIAVENDVVGRPETLLKYLMAAINERIDAPYQTEFEPIFDADSFWSFVDEHGSKLKSIRFKFVVPNMWGTEKELERELQDTRDKTGAERVDIGLSSEHGVDARSDQVANGVEYAERGSGKIFARSMGGATYRSNDEPKRTEISYLNDIALMGENFLRDARKRILGRE
jgi:hypothetical protein